MQQTFEDRLDEVTKELRALEEVEGVNVDSDCLPEGFLNIQIEIKENSLEDIMREYGYEG